jgi:hypothetical protein
MNKLNMKYLLCKPAARCVIFAIVREIDDNSRLLARWTLPLVVVASRV